MSEHHLVVIIIAATVVLWVVPAIFVAAYAAGHDFTMIGTFLRRISLAMLVTLTLLPSAVSSAMGRPILAGPTNPDQRGYGRVEPREIYNGGDESGIVQRIHWHGWGKEHAIGVGRGWYVPPHHSIAEGRTERTTVILFDLGTCEGQTAYDAIEWYFPQHRQHFHSQVYIEACTGDYHTLADARRDKKRYHEELQRLEHEERSVREREQRKELKKEEERNRDEEYERQLPQAQEACATLAGAEASHELVSQPGGSAPLYREGPNGFEFLCAILPDFWGDEPTPAEERVWVQ